MNKYLLMATSVLVVNLLFAQIEGNQRKSYEEVARQIPLPILIVPQQKVKTTNPIDLKSQEDLIRELKVKTKASYGDDGSVRVYHYDAKGRLTRMIDLDKEQEDRYEYEEDSRGRVIQETTYYSDGDVTKRLYEYDDKGREIVRLYISGSGDKSYTNTYYNDELNIVLEEDDSGLTKKWLNDVGQRVRFEVYDENAELLGRGSAECNSFGLPSLERSEAMGLNITDHFEYNNAGQLTLKKRGGLVRAEFTFEYNEQGLEVFSKTENNMGISFSHRYEYT
ncbi:hypothetical protein AC249_AIPGENE10257, partial [Exaiptasia diaphana]